MPTDRILGYVPLLRNLSGGLMRTTRMSIVGVIALQILILILLIAAIAIGFRLSSRQEILSSWQRADAVSQELQAAGWVLGKNVPPCGDADTEGYIVLSAPTARTDTLRDLEAKLAADVWVVTDTDEGILAQAPDRHLSLIAGDEQTGLGLTAEVRLDKHC